MLNGSHTKSPRLAATFATEEILEVDDADLTRLIFKPPLLAFLKSSERVCRQLPRYFDRVKHPKG